MNDHKSAEIRYPKYFEYIFRFGYCFRFPVTHFKSLDLFRLGRFKVIRSFPDKTVTTATEVLHYFQLHADIINN